MKTFVSTARCSALVLALMVSVACGSKSSAEKNAEKPADTAAATEVPHEEHEKEKGIIELTPEQAANAKLAMAKVEKRSEAGLLDATAQIEPSADGQARVGVRIPGRITTIKAGVGDTVKKGQLLAVIDSPELGRAKADYLSAMAGAQVTRETADREKALFDKKITSERDWREAEAAAIRARAEKEAAENRLHALGVGDGALPSKVEGHYSSTLTVTSPIDGVVVERPVTLGQMVQPTDSLFLVMDLREVWILVDVYERDLPQVRLGQKVRVQVKSQPGKTFEGTVQNVGAIVETKTRAVKVRVVLPNPEGALKPGMFASVVLDETIGDKREGLFVPRTAVQREGKRSIVFVPHGDRSFEAREVTLGHEAGELIEVTKGLSEAETVVTTGSFLLKSELKKEELGEGDED